MMLSKMTVNKLASNIRHLRKQKELSQEELANLLGLNRGNIASYEKGTAEPKICNLLNISNYYQVSVVNLTTVDLQCPVALKTARNNYQYELKEEDKAILLNFIEQAEELKKVIESVQVCQTFKIKCMKNVPQELHSIMANFDQLCGVGSLLMNAHGDLLEFVKSRMK